MIAWNRGILSGMRNAGSTDIDALARTVHREQTLIDAGIAWLRRTGSDEDIDIWPTEVLMSLGKKGHQPLRFDDPAFLQCANIRRKHLAIHHYPQGEGRRAFRYLPN